MREKFDFVCSLGAACLCAESLRDAGLRLSSGPFDWVSGGTLADRVGLVVRDFDGWFEADDLEPIGDPNHFGHDGYRNRRTGFSYPHDFTSGVPFAEDYPSVREKYSRRVARFLDCVRTSHRVLFVWIADALLDTALSDGEVVAALSDLRRRFPETGIEMLVVDRAEDGAASGALVRHDGYWRVACGYRRKATSGERPWDIELGPILRVLSNFHAEDYRSAEERCGYKLLRRNRQEALYGKRGRIGRFAVRLEIKLCKHFMKRLKRRGVDMQGAFAAFLDTL